MERRIRAHFNATHHFRAACSSAYNDFLGRSASAGIGRHALHAAVVRVHDVLRGSVDGYCRRAPLTPCWGGVDLALRIRGSSLTKGIMLNEAEFEELALDVIVGEVSWYHKWDVVSRILLMAVVTGIVAVANPDRHGSLAVLFVVYCVTIFALCFLGLRFRSLFFQL